MWGIGLFLGGLGSFLWGSFLSRVDMGFGEDWDGDGRGDFFDGHFAFLLSSSSSLLFSSCNYLRMCRCRMCMVVKEGVVFEYSPVIRI